MLEAKVSSAAIRYSALRYVRFGFKSSLHWAFWIEAANPTTGVGVPNDCSGFM